MVNPNESIARAIDGTIEAMAQNGYDIRTADPKLSSDSVLNDPVARAEIIGHLKTRYATAFGDDVAEAVSTTYKAVFRDLTDDYTKPMTKAAELLRYLEAEHIPWAVVSHKSQDMLEHEYGLLFPNIKRHPVLLGGPERKHKPNPSSLFEAMDRLGIPKKERDNVWMIGDALSTDIGAGRAAGCIPLWFGDDAKKAPADQEPGLLRIGTHQETLTLLKQLCEGHSLGEQQAPARP